MERRTFLRNTSMAALVAGHTGPPPAPAGTAQFPPLRMGIISDLHQDFTFDAPERLKAFIKDARQQQVDMIIQLGDFCCPKKENDVIMDIWKSFGGPGYHVIGNHEMDQSFTRQQVVDYWKIPGRYYAFDLKGWHFIVLDGNDHNPEHKPARQYERFIDEEQLNWLVADVNATQLPVIVCCHQGLDNNGSVENAQLVRRVLEQANEKAGHRKVQLAFSGHFHRDYYNMLNGIHHVQINSAAYCWRGEKYVDSPFSEALNKQYPLIKYMSFYKDPLWAIVDIKGDGQVSISGRRSVFVGKTPEELGMVSREWQYAPAAYIADRRFRLESSMKG